MPNKKSNKSGFTIVELLVVIVVIGILAAITIVTYSNITNKATVASLSSDLDSASRLLKLDQITNMNYPANLAAANNGKGITASSGTTYNYVVNNNITPQSFCLAATKSSQTYKTTESFAPALGDCTNYLPVLYLDTGTPTSYSGSGTNWTDLSANGNNATTFNNIAVPTQFVYGTSNGGTLTFDGNSYASVVSTPALNFSNNGNFSISVWIKPDTITSSWIRGIMVQETYLASGYRFGIMNGGRPSFWTTQSGGTLQLNPASQSLAINQWANVTVTYSNQQAYMYINGAQAASSTGTYVAGSNNVNIGSIVSEYYSGQFGSVSMYNRALTSTEVQQNFNALRSRYGI